MNEFYKDIYGTWKVTTENDSEGKTTKNLGTFTGYVDEIALHLADKCYYSLCFHKIQTSGSNLTPKASKVNVSFDIESGTWSNKNIEEISKAFANRPVTIEDCNIYSAFTIKSNKPEDIAREIALNKLTQEEKKLLGLI